MGVSANEENAINQQRGGFQKISVAGFLLFFVALAVVTLSPSDGMETRTGAESVATPRRLENDENEAYIRAGLMKTNVTSYDGATCTMTVNQPCAMSGFSDPHKWTSVFPGGNTRCLMESSPTYSFQVMPGDNDKLLIYFQGGGACWDQWSFSRGLCTRTQAVEAYNGIFDRTNVANPFTAYTIVHVGFCSGDMHVGDVTRDWGTAAHDAVEQRGYNNARAVVNWAHQNFPNTLSKFVISGSSAGALGAQFWSQTLLREFKYEHAAVIDDAFVGVFAPTTLNTLSKESGLCGVGLLDKVDAARCMTDGVTNTEVYGQAISMYPQVSFASITSKVDKTQMNFYNAVKQSVLHQPGSITQADFWKQAVAILSVYAKHSNYISYTLNEVQHEHLNYEHGVYWTYVGTPRFGLAFWLAGLPVLPGHAAKAVCEPPGDFGYSIPSRPRPTPAGADGWDYCPGALANDTATDDVLFP